MIYRKERQRHSPPSSPAAVKAKGVRSAVYRGAVLRLGRNPRRSRSPRRQRIGRVQSGCQPSRRSDQEHWGLSPRLTDRAAWPMMSSHSAFWSRKACVLGQSYEHLLILSHVTTHRCHHDAAWVRSSCSCLSPISLTSLTTRQADQLAVGPCVPADAG